MNRCFSIYLGLQFSSKMFLGYKFVHLLNCTKVFHFLDAILNEIVFSISFLEYSLLVYTNTTAFCILILYYLNKQAVILEDQQRNYCEPEWSESTSQRKWSWSCLVGVLRS